MKGLLMARVSSPEQAADGFSLPSQEKHADLYAQRHGIEFVKRWCIAESAQESENRKAFKEMLGHAKRDPTIKALVFEKPDRMSRNYADLLKIYDLINDHGKHIHFFKIGLVITKDSPPEDLKRMEEGVSEGRNFILRLKSETAKGMLEKVEQGDFPGLAPTGYKNDTVMHTIHEFDPDEAPWVKRAFELIRTGRYSLESCRRELFAEGCPQRLLPWVSSLEKWIKNPFYYGAIVWRGKIYRGNQPILVTKEESDEAQAALKRPGKTVGRHDNPFARFMTCARCGCAITVERHSKKSGLEFTYHHCTWRKGKCGNNGYFPEPVILEMLGEVVGTLQLDSDFVDFARRALANEDDGEQWRRRDQLAALKQQIAKLKARRDRCYEDKLDGRISETDWVRMSNQWADEEVRALAAIQRLESANPAKYVFTADRVFELGKGMKSLFKLIEPQKKRILVNLLCLNLKLDVKKIDADYRTPWGALSPGGDNQKWGG